MKPIRQFQFAAGDQIIEIDSIDGVRRIGIVIAQYRPIPNAYFVRFDNETGDTVMHARDMKMR